MANAGVELDTPEDLRQFEAGAGEQPAP